MNIKKNIASMTNARREIASLRTKISAVSGEDDDERPDRKFNDLAASFKKGSEKEGLRRQTFETRRKSVMAVLMGTSDSVKAQAAIGAEETPKARQRSKKKVGFNGTLDQVVEIENEL